MCSKTLRKNQTGGSGPEGSSGLGGDPVPPARKRCGAAPETGLPTPVSPGFNGAVMKQDLHRTRVRPPKQERSRRTLRRILDASRALLTERDPRDVSLREIADRAEVSMSSLFARFPSKDALLDHLHAELCEHRLAEVQQSVAALEESDRSLEEIAYDGICFLLDRVEKRGGLERAFQQVALAHDQIRQREASFRRRRLGVLRGFVERSVERPVSGEQIESVVDHFWRNRRE